MAKASPLRTLLFVCLVLSVGLAINVTVAQDQTPPPKPTTSDCLGCHDGTLDEMGPDERVEMVEAVPADWKLKGRKANAKRAGVSLKIDLTKMKKSVHGDDCSMCHTDINEIPHLAKLQPVNCALCHEEYDALYREGAHFQALQNGSELAPACADCHGAHYMLPMSDTNNPLNRNNLAASCGQCHTSEVIPGRSMTGAYDQWQESVHAQVTDGRVNATCSDCHDSHGGRYATGSTAKPNISRTCGKCHQKIKEDYHIGVHGQALARGNLSSPTCTDCHGVHGIYHVGDRRSDVYGFCSVEGCCAQCHQAERINSRFGIRSTIESYSDSFHGLALKKGDMRAASCASCHGAHDILNSSDPRSSISKDNLTKTCGKCHPGIGDQVTKGKVHPELSSTAETTGEKVQFWVKWIYLGLIPAVLGFMFLHNLLDWIKKIREHLARRRLEGKYLRLTKNERIQHIVLMSSFTLLVITGFALTFSWKIPGLSGEANETLRAVLHRIAGIAMGLWMVYHFYWVIATKRGRGYVMAMIPKLKDAYDLLQALGYNLGLVKERPKFDRFSYIEKAEYLAMIWGGFVMVLSGLILWFEEPVLRFLPLWAIDVAHIVHYMEAILATLAIIIWHFYSVLFNPDVAPMATHWLTGTLTEEEMKHEHALELERIKRGEGQSE